jgi:hypothetical protein
LRQQACIEDVDYRNPRGLDRALFQKLVEGEWITPMKIWSSSGRPLEGFHAADPH